MSNERVMITNMESEEAEDLVVLVGDLDFGEGMVEWSEEFDSQTNLMKADLLQDWIDTLRGKYEAIVEEGFFPKGVTLN